MVEIKLFGKWSVDGIKVSDIGLKPYINLSPRFVIKTGGRNAKSRFHKSYYNIVERLMNKLMIPGHRSKKHKLTSGRCTGKAVKVYNIVERALELVEKKTNMNPIGILVKAIENSATREEVITIEYGGAKYPKAGECAPQRRIDLTLRIMTQNSYQKSFNSKKSIEKTLADEIVFAYEKNSNSAAIQKKLEIERQADSSR